MSDRADLVVGTLGSALLNLLYLLLFHDDQRIVLMLFATVLAGMLMLLSPSKGALGMGIILGAGVAIAVGLGYIAIDGSIVTDLRG